MVMLIFVRDVLIAVLLSWIGVDMPEQTSNTETKKQESQAHLMSGGCDSAILTLEAQPVSQLEESKISWFHS